MRRRDFIQHSAPLGIVSSAVALSGCSGDNSDGSGFSGDNEDSGPSTIIEPSGTQNIREDEWCQWEVTGDEMNIEGSITVDLGPNIDVLIMEPAYYERYTNRDEYQYLESSKEDTPQANFNAPIGSGTRHIVVDNTDAGEAAPPTNLDDDVVTVDYDFTVEGY